MPAEPQKPQSQPQSQPQSPAAPGPAPAGEGRRRILVVDDNEDAAETLALLLGVMGHETRTVHDGPSAIEEARAFDPEVIFLDIGLPGMTGHEAARRLRELPRGRELYLVALTGYGQEEDRRRSAEAGFDRHLVKPVGPDKLDEVLQAARTRREGRVTPPGPEPPG